MDTTTGRFVTIKKNGVKHHSYQGSLKWKELHDAFTVKKATDVAITANPEIGHGKHITGDSVLKIADTPVDSFQSYLTAKSDVQHQLMINLFKHLLIPRYKLNPEYQKTIGIRYSPIECKENG